jgi:hypothetical protein
VELERGWNLEEEGGGSRGHRGRMGTRQQDTRHKCEAQWKGGSGRQWNRTKMRLTFAVEVKKLRVVAGVHTKKAMDDRKGANRK